jgi:HEAT repeat protein
MLDRVLRAVVFFVCQKSNSMVRVKIMDKRPYNYCLVASLAVLLLLDCQSVVVAQKVDWQADELTSPFPAAQTEKELIEQLQTGPDEAKAVACKQLSIYGGKASVPALAKLLGDERISSWSRIALEAIPDPSADAALIEAAGRLQGLPLVGAINSIGVRRSAGGIDVLEKRLSDSDEQVAVAAAMALGSIGGEKAIHALHQAFANAKPAVRSAICEGGILCAERLLAVGEKDRAAHIYEFIRTEDVPEQRKLEATRGAILARGEDGIPLLVEQLRSADKKRFAMALTTAREVKNSQAVVEALVEELAKAPAGRASLIVTTIGDCSQDKLPPAILQAAKSGDKRVRLAALPVVGRLGDASTIPALLETALDANADISQAAKSALAALGGKNINAELSRRLPTAKGKTLAALIEVLGHRRADTAADLVKILNNADRETRAAVLTALGATAGPNELTILITQVTNGKEAADAEVAARALQTACMRMPDREATAAKIAAAIPAASTAAKVRIIEVLGEMGGPNALKVIDWATQGDREELKDAATRALGKWMTPDAAPVLLRIAKDSSPQNKYQTRALRGYLRIARQLNLPDDQRIEMCRAALKLAVRPEERKLALEALKKCPSAESVKLASSLFDDEQTRDSAVEVAIFIGEKIKEKDPAAAKSAGEKALNADPNGKMADRARALTKVP